MRVKEGGDGGARVWRVKEDMVEDAGSFLRKLRNWRGPEIRVWRGERGLIDRDRATQRERHTHTQQMKRETRERHTQRKRETRERDTHTGEERDTHREREIRERERERLERD